MKNLSIPVLSDEELMRRYLKIKPVAKINEVTYWLKNYTIKEMRGSSFFWNLVPDRREPVGDALSNHTHYDFQCLHTFDYHGFFKPSIAEVLAQIPEDVLKHYTIDAFEIIDRPTCSGDLNAFRKALNQGFHVSVVRLYIRVNP